MSIKSVGPTLKQVAVQILGELTAPTTVDEMVSRVLERYPATAKDPRKRTRDELHSNEMIGVELVYLDPKTIVPLHLAMQGVCFRVPVGPNEIKQGFIELEPSFLPFLANRFQRLTAKDDIEVRDANGQVICTHLTTVPITRKNALGDVTTRDYDVFDLRDWLRDHHARAKDSIRVTILNWRPVRLLFEFESYADYDQAAFASQNRALADCIQTLLDESYDERIYTFPAILTAYARMPSARSYPGDHWYAVLANDPRFFVTDFDIKRGEGETTVEFLRDPFGSHDRRKPRITREQGNQVYRFTATTYSGKKKRIIEILGKDTLADLDDVLREAFDLDTSDHLSEFTRITPRGKGKKPREEPYGEINPFEPTPAMELHIAGLGLTVGAELEYLYDFGDSLRHKLVLESIGLAERRVEYPRVITVRSNQ